jgi:hypothetical protein
MNSGLFAIMGDYGHDFFHWRHFRRLPEPPCAVSAQDEFSIFPV